MVLKIKKHTSLTGTTSQTVDGENRCSPRRFTLPISDNQADNYFVALRKPKEETDASGKTSVRKKIIEVFHSKAFHIAVVTLCCLDGLLVVCMLLMEIEVLKLKPGTLRSRLQIAQFSLECVSVSIVSLFLIEILCKCWLFGLRFYRQHWLEIVDAVVCVVSFGVDIYNIVRHTQHHQAQHAPANIHANMTPEGHNSTAKLLDTEESESMTVQNTLADAAGLLVLFRLWRVVRIVNDEANLVNIRRFTVQKAWVNHYIVTLLPPNRWMHMIIFVVSSSAQE
ncbi:unnamed protein product [Echinostoma caproni]|uniref:Voltage-gated hydrogen channel 1 n=1 Tax=Echinostoma caproni TaxID=27848 RepID=A0A183AA36_9TREM|nr:unnamed protein product [Echinostoma caproni]